MESVFVYSHVLRCLMLSLWIPAGPTWVPPCGAASCCAPALECSAGLLPDPLPRLECSWWAAGGLLPCLHVSSTLLRTHRLPAQPQLAHWFSQLGSHLEGGSSFLRLEPSCFPRGGCSEAAVCRGVSPDFVFLVFWGSVSWMV